MSQPINSSIDNSSIDNSSIDNSKANSLSSISKSKVIITRDDIDVVFLERLNDYYKLKHDYEIKRQSKKNGILKDNTLSLKRKQEKFMKMNINCVNCGRNVGTIFEHNTGILTSVCGDKVAPCNLNININRGKYVKLEELLDVFQTGVDDLKEEIIATKLDLLFGYANEVDTLKKFNNLKEELTKDLESVLEYKTQFIEIVSNLDNKPVLNAKMTIFYNKISLIKSTIDEFNETGQIQLIKDMITLYDTELSPLLVELRSLKYKYMAMEYDDNTDTHRLVRNVFTLQDMTIPFETPKVVSYIIGNDSVKKSKTALLRDDDDDYTV